MLRVTEYVAKSLKVIRNDTVEYGVYDGRISIPLQPCFPFCTVSETFNVE